MYGDNSINASYTASQQISRVSVLFVASQERALVIDQTDIQIIMKAMQSSRQTVQDLRRLIIFRRMCTGHLILGVLGFLVQFSGVLGPAFPLSGVTAYLTHKILVKTHKKRKTVRQVTQRIFR